MITNVPIRQFSQEFILDTYSRCLDFVFWGKSDHQYFESTIYFCRMRITVYLSLMKTQLYLQFMMVMEVRPM